MSRGGSSRQQTIVGKAARMCLCNIHGTTRVTVRVLWIRTAVSPHIRMSKSVPRRDVSEVGLLRGEQVVSFRIGALIKGSCPHPSEAISRPLARTQQAGGCLHARKKGLTRN